MDWFVLMLIAAIGFGITNFLLQMSTVKQYDKYGTVLILSLMHATLSLIAVIYRGGFRSVLPTLLVMGVVDSFLFFTRTQAMLGSLERGLPMVLVMPVFRCSTALVILYGVMGGQELTAVQWLGVLLGFAAALLSVSTHSSAQNAVGAQEQNRKRRAQGITLLMVATMMSAGTVLVGNASVGVHGLDVFEFMLVSQFMTAILNATRLATKSTLGTGAIRGWRLGAVAGVANFASLSLLLQGWKQHPPIAIGVTLYGLYVVIPVALAAMWYPKTERLTLRRVAAVGLAIIAVLVIEVDGFKRTSSAAWENPTGPDPLTETTRGGCSHGS